jgi:hypothetical protein
MDNPTPPYTPAAISSSFAHQNIQESLDGQQKRRSLELKTNPPHPPADFNPVPSSPFWFFSLPFELRRNILLLYLSSLPAKGQGSRCDCFKVYSINGSTLHRFVELTVEHPCYNLHAQFNCHAKFLPLLLTNRQMHEEFRPLRYAYGEFHLVPHDDVRSGLFRNRDWPQRHIASHFILSPFAQYNVTVITPFPDTCISRTTAQPPLPALELHKVPAQIWNEISSVVLEMNFVYERNWKTVREVLQGLVAAIKKRKTPLKRLTVNMSWGRVEEDSRWDTGYLHQDSLAEIWSSMVKSLGTIQWGREGAEEVVFGGEDYWDGDADVDAGEDDNGEMRVFRCTNFEDFEKGLKGAENEGRLDVEYWHCGC